MGHDFTITLSESSQRAPLFRDVFGALTVHVCSPVPELARLPGFSEPQLVYLLDLEQISSEQRLRMVAYIAERFGYEPGLVEHFLDKEGMPILARDCCVVVQNPQRWF